MKSIVGQSSTAANPDANSEASAAKLWKLFMIIHHPRNAHVLLCTNSERPELPCFVTKPRPTVHFFEKTAEWIPEVQQYFGFTFDITLLRCVSNSGRVEDYREPDQLSAVLVLESHGESVAVPGGTEWMNPSCITLPHDATECVKRAIEQFVHQCGTGVQPTFRPLFARQGWYDGAVDWMRHQLLANGFAPIDEVTQIKCTYRGTVLKAATSREAVYLKCSPYFTNEASTCKQLARLIPKFVAAPIATDVERRLLLTEDYSVIVSPFLFDLREGIQWSHELAEIHQCTVGKKQILLDAGLSCLTFDVLQTEFENVLAHVEQMQTKSSKVVKQLKRYSEEIRRDCQRVEGLGLPSTFVHGDLYFSNIYQCSGREAAHGIMDFGEAAFSHPFIDLIGCPDRYAYAEKWISFLEIHFPQIARRISMDELQTGQVLCIKLFPLWEAVKLYKEMEAVAYSAPPAMVEELVAELKVLLRNYEPQPLRNRRVRHLNK